ncbi:hypothetical protein [Enterobacter hormaechei]|uniref:hypothetical protein n=1 Tax=Enterobacter hormaechei TaxID=158836 RepID=UPI0038509D76
MKPSYEELERKLIESERYGRQTDITIDTLEMQLKAGQEAKLALAAELNAVEAIHNKAVFITDEHYEQCPPQVQKMIRALAVLQIPAYKAYQAELQAQGVDMVIAAKKHQKEIMHPDTLGRGEAQASLRNLITELELFAAQLRQEAAQ